MTNLAVLLDHSASRWPDRQAVVDSIGMLTYRELLEEANRAASMLRRTGIAPGDRVALSASNNRTFTVAYFGILKAGAIVVPLNTTLTAREIDYHLEDSGASLHLSGLDARDLPWSADESSGATYDSMDDDVAVLIYTSGTTGQPKGAELTHGGLRSNALATAVAYDVTPGSGDAYLCVLPLFHSFGQTAVQNGAIATGNKIVMIERFDPAVVLAALDDEEITVFAGVPTMYWAMLNSLQTAEADGVDLDRIRAKLRVAASGGAALAYTIHEDFSRRLGITILEGYGLSETSPAVTSTRLGDPVRLGSIGLPLPGIQVRLVAKDGNDIAQGFDDDGRSEVGEILVKGPNVMRGYHRRAAETRAVLQDGWLRTGDLARRDVDGHLYIVDRSKDLIIRGGYNVYPRELEEVLMTHLDVSLVAVIGVPHASLGEEIKAVVVRAAGSTITAEELSEWSSAQFAPYKRPRLFEFRDQLPTNATGKILKRALTSPTSGV